MRAGVAVIMAVTCFLPALARAQQDTAAAARARAISLHPDVLTVLQLPGKVIRARTLHQDEFRVGFFASRIYVQPWPDARAGAEALLEVETGTQQWSCRLRVVERADDAAQVFLVRAAVEACVSDARPAAPPEAMPEPAASALPGVPEVPLPGVPEVPPPSEPDAGHAPAPERTEPAAGRADVAAGSPRFTLFLHATLVPAGITALDLPGYVPVKGWRPHRGFGLRLALEPRDTWWSVEVGIGAERLDAPTVHVRDRGDMRRDELRVSGSWLRADAGLRAGTGTTWKPTVYLGLGLHVHLRKAETTTIVMEQRDPSELREDMHRGAVLTLGLGLQRQVGDALLGIDFQMRQGVPADYVSMTMVLSAGVFLDQGE